MDYLFRSVLSLNPNGNLCRCCSKNTSPTQGWSFKPMVLDFCSHFVKGMEMPFLCSSSITGFNHNAKLNPMSRS